ncbi:aminopeptidase P family N-terminal domain-containing protein [Candidatus Peregrinibacteria bacterium]|nr:aminopeptidase P family N-terminal domain-containing protein [Candidatus Peregrinibacteria bacterium]
MSQKAIYITSKENIQYLTGFTGSSGSILLTPKILYFFTDSRYFEETKKTIRLFGSFTKNTHEESYKNAWLRLKKIGYQPTLKLVEFKKGNKTHPLTELIKKHDIQTLLFEENHVSFARYQNFKKLLKGLTRKKIKKNSIKTAKSVNHAIKLKPSSGIMESLRAIKTPQEIEYTRKAQRITEKVYETLKKTIKIGQTELEIDRKIRMLAEDFGAEGFYGNTNE